MSESIDNDTHISNVSGDKPINELSINVKDITSSKMALNRKRKRSLGEEIVTMLSSSELITSPIADASPLELEDENQVRVTDIEFQESNNKPMPSPQESESLDSSTQIEPSSDSSKKTNRWLNLLKKNWFLIGMIVAIIAAYLYPDLGKDGGPIKPELTIRIIAVMIVFFFIGLSLKVSELMKAILKWRLHIIVQLYSLGFVPLFTMGLVAILKLISGNFNTLLFDGLVIASALPTTVAAGVIFVKSIKGDVSSATFNSITGNLSGVVLSPLILLFYFGSSSSTSFFSVLLSIIIRVVIPLFIGLSLRSYFKPFFKRHHPPSGKIGSSIVLIIIWSSFSTTFTRELGVTLSELVILLVIIVCLFSFFFLVAYYLGQSLQSFFSREERSVLIVMGPQKTLALGIPLLQIIFEGNPNIGIIAVPLLIYHPMQLLICGMFVPKLKRWIEFDSNE